MEPRYRFTRRVREAVRDAAPDALLGLVHVGLVTSAGAAGFDERVIRLDHPVGRLAETEFGILVTGPGLMPGGTAEVVAQVYPALGVPARIGVVERLAAGTTAEDLLYAARVRMRLGRPGWLAVDLDHARALVRVA